MLFKWRSLQKNIGTFLLHTLAPPICAQCKCYLDRDTVACAECFSSVKSIASKELIITKTKSIKVFAVSHYNGLVRQLIMAKYWSDIIASRQLGQLMWQCTTLAYCDFDVIVPIPLHWTRRAYRGFNQAEVIAHVLSSKSGKPIVHALKRTIRTRYQSHLTSEQRKENVKQAFMPVVAMQNVIQKKRVLLVDDVMTTGVTLQAAAKELFKMRPASVSVGVAARVI